MRVKKLMQAGYFRQRPIVLDGMKSAGLFPMPSRGKAKKRDVVGLSYRHLSQSLDWFSILRRVSEETCFG